MKKIMIVLLLLTTLSCGEGPVTTAEPVVKQETSDTVLAKNHSLYSHTVTEVTYDGCQYILIKNGNATWGTHKGNCNNPLHQYK